MQYYRNWIFRIKIKYLNIFVPLSLGFILSFTIRELIGIIKFIYIILHTYFYWPNFHYALSIEAIFATISRFIHQLISIQSPVYY